MSWEAACRVYGEAEEKVMERVGKKPIGDTWIADMIDSIAKDEWENTDDIAEYILDCMREEL